ncbi:MAG: 16S rRNA (cytosine(1402)-N(4))-methyltransferase RsmH [Planctomycetes bacterium]|nr:16S rRNA (cytosine(1402)-N(4))-methyltransferase RsmH [Planctomycetota bacterium]
MERDSDTTNGGADRSVHEPVLAAEVVRALGGEEPAALEGWIVDATLGAGGHASRLLAALPNVRLLGLDQDPQILQYALRALAPFERRVRVRRGRLSQLEAILDTLNASRVVGMLFDLGASSLQLDSAVRGFSFQSDGPLDMRMDPERERTAADIVNHWDESDLADLFFYEGGETRSRRIARAIVESRRRAPFQRTLALADLIERTLGAGKLHPATRTFQALRRAVNEEGEELLAGLAAAQRWMVDGGRLAVISFHSGEDAEVKRFFVEGEQRGDWRALTRRPTTATRDEQATNRRSRSALLRVGVRVRRSSSALERRGGLA